MAQIPIFVVVLALACGTLGLILAVLSRSFKAPSLPITADWIGELSVERYRPMMRLLREDDFRFLRSQPGFTPRMETRLRAARYQLFRGYLGCLKTDFGRVCLALKVLMVQSQFDRPDLASVLVRNQIAFACGTIRIQLQLMLYRWGIGAVDIDGLVRRFDVMRLELRTLAPAAADAGA